MSLVGIVVNARGLAYPEGFREEYAKAMDDPAREEEYLRASLARNPHFSEAAIALAASLEQRGEWGAAEQELRSLTGRDRRFRPRWALLNFEARQGRRDDFWELAQTMVPMSFGDHRALIDLLWAMRPEAGFVAARLGEARAPLLMEFVAFLMERGELRVAREVFARLAAKPYESTRRANAGPVATAEERRQRGLDLCDLHLDRKDGAGAMEVWQTLVGAGLVGEVSERFAREPIGRGFDWRPMRVAGVEQRRGSEGWRIEFSGQQGDEAVLLSRWSYRSGARQWGMEVAWGDPQGLEWRFEPLGGGGWVLAKLHYKRALGTMPTRGALVIREAGWLGAKR